MKTGSKKQVIYIGLILLVMMGIGPVHHYIHILSEKDSGDHNPLTCPQCQTIKSLGTETPELFASTDCIDLSETGRIRSFLTTAPTYIPIDRPVGRAPPLA